MALRLRLKSLMAKLKPNEEKYRLIRDGIKVTVKKPNGETETQTAAVIDFKNPENNYFLAVKELKIHGDLYRRRTDIVGFVNGIPLLFVELKKTTVDVCLWNLKRQRLMCVMLMMIITPIIWIRFRICFIIMRF